MGFIARLDGWEPFTVDTTVGRPDVIILRMIKAVGRVCNFFVTYPTQKWNNEYVHSEEQ